MNSSKRAAKLAYYYQNDFDFAVIIESWFVNYKSPIDQIKSFSNSNKRINFHFYSDLDISWDELCAFMQGLKHRNYVYHCSNYCREISYCSLYCKNLLIFSLIGNNLNE